jgi:glycosyltransferase involved in cell wall biosynthesis
VRIAVVVHNSVVNDARVVKEAAALAAAGHTVEIHGIAKGTTNTQQTITDLKIPVLLTRMPPLVSATAVWALAGIFALIVLLAISLALPGLTAWLSPRSPAAILLLVSSILLGLGILVRFRHRVAAAIVQNLIGRTPLKVVYTWLRRSTVAKALLSSVSRRPPPDVVHLHDVAALLAARELKARYGCKIVWDAHEIYQSLSADADGSVRAAFSRKVYAFLIRRYSPYVDHFITISQSLAQFYAEHHPRLGSATVVMNAVPRTLRPDYDGRLHRAAGIAPDKKIILYQGGFSELRGLPALVSAARHFDEAWTLVMMGWGELEQELKTLASHINREAPAPRVVFLPGVPHSELQMWTAGASLGCIPYENTGLNHLYCTPNKLWEYPSAGVPILCTDLIELGNAVRTHGIGTLIPRDYREADIVEVVNSITGSQLEQWRSACFRFAEVENWESNALKLVELYKKIPGDILPAREKAPT